VFVADSFNTAAELSRGASIVLLVLVNGPKGPNFQLFPSCASSQVLVCIVAG
jgi:hypothetical protein